MNYFENVLFDINGLNLSLLCSIFDHFTLIFQNFEMASTDEAELPKDAQSSNVEEKDKKRELLMAKKRMLERKNGL